MYKLYFSPSQGRDRLIATVWSNEAARACISQFLKEKEYKAPYWISHETLYKGKEATVYDVGSHTEFFYVVEVK